jgi:nucleotidyltransferase/DNA polymerase involved in DNA repair
MSLEKYVGIPVSIGVSHTRMKAKIFSKINKPYGIYIGLGSEKELFRDLPLAQIPFV